MYFFPLLLSLSGLASSHSQIVLNHEPPTFIDSSIFGRQEYDTNSIGDIQILAPTYQAVAYEDTSTYQELGTFAHLEFLDCTQPKNDGSFDIGIVGHPFDLGVSYRPGARFGPNGARQGARRIHPQWAYRCVKFDR